MPICFTPSHHRIDSCLCRKIYTTENAYRSHLVSKKHKEAELKAASRPQEVQAPEASEVGPDAPLAETETETTSPPLVTGSAKKIQPLPPLVISEDATEEEIERTLDERIAAARNRLSSMDCLFCPTTFNSLEDNLTHMSLVHSFFIPDAEYLVDLAGLVVYLGEKIAVGNVCLYCNGKGREFRTLEAVRKHMVDKSHCKIAYDSQKDQLEISDYYDFTSSYPDAKKADENEDEWEDVADDGEEPDEFVDVEDTDDKTSSEDEVPESQVTFGDSHLELVLPSGARIGHRSMKRYYAQSFRGGSNLSEEDPKSGRALVRQLLANKNSALVPVGGGFGAFGRGTQVIKARNRGEAREAGRHVREFRDVRRREEFKTKVAFIHNSQKHFRDPLLQVSILNVPRIICSTEGTTVIHSASLTCIGYP